MLTLQHKRAVVTGAGSGIGKAIAIQFAARGAEVHIVDLNESGAAAAASEIRSGNGLAVVHPCDVSDQEAVKKMFSRIGTPDILVNSAGISHIGTLETTAEADFDRIYRVNVKGVYNCLYAAVPLMKEAGKGIILNLASVANHVGLPDRFAYSMSKGAVYAMTLSVARDYIRHGIRCNSISPARVHTPFVDGFLAKNYPGREKEMFEKLSKTQPIGRMAKPEEIAQLALFLCSDEAAFITGTDYPIDGGFINLNS
jgi:NAD(P)-dependent dehydrogenase (short-subunit alcohol dehydrogenase family)